jgi:hypothetical protein
MIKGCEKAFTPAIVEEGKCAAGQVAPPISQTGTGKVAAGPMSRCLAANDMIADYLNACTDPGKITVGTKSEYAMTRGTTVALQIKTGRVSTEVTLDITVAPETIMPAAGTYTRPFPGIILAQSKNLLEQNGNKIYHDITNVAGVSPPVVNGWRVLRKLSAPFIQGIKNGLF